MNGREIEHLLSLIDQNMLRNTRRAEILAYLRDNEPAVLGALRSTEKVTVPTSSGSVEINLADLQALVA